MGLEKKPGLALPYRSCVKLGYGYDAYTDDIDNEQAGLIEVAAPLGTRTAIGRMETIDRFGSTELLISGELYAPLWRAASGYAGFSAGVGAEFVPETDSQTLSSQLTWRITERIQVFASRAFGTAGERLSAIDDISRIDIVSLHLGVSVPLAEQVSMEAIGMYENRDASYTRGGLAINLLYHW